jgi:hypothetical protein
MVKKLEPETVSNTEPVKLQSQVPGLEIQFEKKQDKSLVSANEVTISDEQRERITKVCPHYFDLRDRYAEYKNFDDEGKNPLPLRIDRVHELSGFEATIAQADPTQELNVFPTRLIKTFDFSSGSRQPFLIVDKRVIGIDKEGRSTNISSVRTGRFKYPSQFAQRPDGDWYAVERELKTILNIPFSKEKVMEFANVGNPFIKKYVVWHPDGVRRGHFTLQEFTDLTDDEQISLIETGKR